MQTVSEIKFTYTEIKILACFSANVHKASAIAEILDKNTRTIYSHLNNIKQKINVCCLDEITTFVQSADEFKNLKEIFIKQYKKAQKRSRFAKYLSWTIAATVFFICYYFVSKSQFLNQVEAQQFLFSNYNIPIRNNNFTGREELFDKIKETLNRNKTGIRVQAVVGAGGVGKTQLAVEYAYRAFENKEYGGIVWIFAENESSINFSYQSIADKLNVHSYGLKPAELRKAVHKALALNNKDNRILFILDNVPSQEEIEPYLSELHTQWPLKWAPHILITSRSQYWEVPFFILDVFTSKEAEAFIKKHLIYEKDSQIKRLAERLYHYPLALSQAVAYIKLHTNIKNYLSLHRSHQKEAASNISPPMDQAAQSLYGILEVILSKISDSAKNILKISAYLNPDFIKLDLFDDMLRLDMDAAIHDLRRYSLIIFNDNESFRLHRLLQVVVRDMIGEEGIWRDKVVAMVLQAAEKFDKQDINTWNEARTWFPHMPYIKEYVQNLSLRVRLLYQYGHIAKHLGFFTMSRDLFLEELEIYKKHPEFIEKNFYIEINKSLCMIEQLLGDYMESKAYCMQAMQSMRGDVESAKSLEMADIFHMLGILERCLGRYHTSVDYLEKALAIKNLHYKDPNHIARANTLNNLGLAKVYTGGFAEARKILQQALAIKQKNYKQPEHISICHTLNNIGVLDLYEGNFEKARELFEQIIQIKIDHYQEKDHITLEYPLRYIAIAEEGLGLYDKALSHLEKAYDISSKHYRDLPARMRFAYSQSLGLPKLSEHHMDKALPYFEKSLFIMKKFFGDNHHFVARYHALLGQAYARDHQTAEALSQYEQAIKILESTPEKSKFNEKNLQYIQELQEQLHEK